MFAALQSGDMGPILAGGIRTKSGLGIPGLLPLLFDSSVILGGSNSTSVCPPSKLGSVIESVDKLGQAGHWTAWHMEDVSHKGVLVYQSMKGCISLSGEHCGAGSDCRPCRKVFYRPTNPRLSCSPHLRQSKTCPSFPPIFSCPHPSSSVIHHFPSSAFSFLPSLPSWC